MKHEQDGKNAMDSFIAQLEAWGVGIGSSKVSDLRSYASLLAEYDEANVIGTRDVHNIILDHVLDSLSILTLRSLQFEGRLIDVGSGGGLPGVPLAIAVPDLQVSLLEATRKKVDFLRQAQTRLHLENVRLLNERAEEIGAVEGFRDAYDLATSRAVSSLPVVMEYCAPFVKEGGHILAMKGRLQEDELDAGRSAAARLAATLVDVASVSLHPDLEQKERQIAVFRKTGPTPSGYPRRTGLAKKRPLGTRE